MKRRTLTGLLSGALLLSSGIVFATDPGGDEPQPLEINYVTFISPMTYDTYYEPGMESDKPMGFQWYYTGEYTYQLPDENKQMYSVKFNGKEIENYASANLQSLVKYKDYATSKEYPARMGIASGGYTTPGTYEFSIEKGAFNYGTGDPKTEDFVKVGVSEAISFEYVSKPQTSNGRDAEWYMWSITPSMEKPVESLKEITINAGSYVYFIINEGFEATFTDAEGNETAITPANIKSFDDGLVIELPQEYTAKGNYSLSFADESFYFGANKYTAAQWNKGLEFTWEVGEAVPTTLESLIPEDYPGLVANETEMPGPYTYLENPSVIVMGSLVLADYEAEVELLFNDAPIATLSAMDITITDPSGGVGGGPDEGLSNAPQRITEGTGRKIIFPFTKDGESKFTEPGVYTIKVPADVFGDMYDQELIEASTLSVEVVAPAAEAPVVEGINPVAGTYDNLDLAAFYAPVITFSEPVKLNAEPTAILMMCYKGRVDIPAKAIKIYDDPQCLPESEVECGKYVKVSWAQYMCDMFAEMGSGTIDIPMLFNEVFPEGELNFEFTIGDDTFESAAGVASEPYPFTYVWAPAEAPAGGEFTGYLAAFDEQDNRTDIDEGTTVTNPIAKLSYDIECDEVTITDNDGVYLSGPEGQVTGSVSAISNLIFIDFSPSITADGDYTFVILPGAIEVDGVANEKAVEINFTLEVGEALAIVSSDPTSAAEISEITVTFNQDVEIQEEGKDCNLEVFQDGEWTSTWVVTPILNPGTEANQGIIEMTYLYEPKALTEKGKYRVVINGLDDYDDWATPLYVEFEVTDNTGIASIFGDATEYNVFSVNGVVVKRAASAADLQALPAGLYIINGKTVMVK